MREIVRVNVGLNFTFNYFGDTIVYKTLRTFNASGDIFDAIKSYIKYWVNDYGEKYGTCLTCDVEINTIPVCSYRFGRNGISECNGKFM